MTTTAQALAAAADGLARIVHALAVQDAVDFGDADWLPGDPLWPDPRLVPAGFDGGTQVVRPLFQIFDDGVWVFARCAPCQVNWIGTEPCWVCGTDRPRPRSHGSLDRAHALRLALSVNALPAMEQLEEAQAAVSRLDAQMRALSERVAADMDERLGELLERITAPAPEPPTWAPNPNDFTWAFVPSVADPAAPTVAELASAVPIDGLFSGIFVRPEPEPVLDERLAAIDPDEHRERVVSITEPDPDDTVTRRGFFGEVTLARPRYPRPDAAPVLDNQENP